MNKQVIFAALFALCLSATQVKPSLAQGPVQQPIDGTAPTTPAPTTAGPVAAPINNVLPLNADQYTDEQVKSLGQGPAFPYTLLETALSGDDKDPAVNEKGAVNYNKLQLNQDLALFNRAVGLADLTQFPVFKDKDEDGKVVIDNKSELAFWINAYNGLFLKAIATAYPVKQISQIKDLQTAKRLVGGKTYTFPEMRDKIAALDARAMFTLVDGTIYGPRVPKSAYRYFGLGTQMNNAIRGFITDPIRVPVPNRLDKTVFVSPWMETIDSYYKKGATKTKYSGVRNILTAYATSSALRNYYGSGDYEVRFFPPNDTINDTLNAL